MGAGASNTVDAAIEATSVENLREVFQNVSADNRAKLAVALLRDPHVYSNPVPQQHPVHVHSFQTQSFPPTAHPQFSSISLTPLSGSATSLVPLGERPLGGGVSAGVEAAMRLQMNLARVVQDITNPGPQNIDGKELTQQHLQRVDPRHRQSVEKMIVAVCSGLRSNTIPTPSQEEAPVWERAARYLRARVQGSDAERPGRNPDMSPASAEALRTMLGHIEAACNGMGEIDLSAGVDAAMRLEANLARVVQDITNPGPWNIDGKELTQQHLQRVDPRHRPSVEKMIVAVCSGLRSNTFPTPSQEEAPVWEQTARYLRERVQGSEAERPFRKPDMPPASAQALRAVLGHIEAACKRH